MNARLLIHPTSTARIARVQEWLADLGPGEEALTLTASAESGRDLLRAAALRHGAVFGLARATLGQVARELASRAGMLETPLSATAFEAVVARAVHTLRAGDELSAFGEALDTPGFSRAAARALTELRWAEVSLHALAAKRPALAAIAREVTDELIRGQWIDRPTLFRAAARAAADTNVEHPWLGLPLAALDLPLRHPAERDLLAAMSARAPRALVVLPDGDTAAIALASAALKVEPVRESETLESALTRLQDGLFAERDFAQPDLDDTVTVFSAPGESREAVEIARMVLARAKAGVPFDRMAILVRSPLEYVAHLEEALSRAQIPAHFSRGASRPLASGRAFIALLACAGENLSARRFAEYLSLGQVPPLSDAPEEALARAPRRWEALLVEAAVIGGLDRWERRLTGLAHEFERQKGELEDPDSPRAAGFDRRLADLQALREYAMPLIGSLQDLPVSATWEAWLAALRALAERALRWPERVLAVLAELAPMRDLGPVTLWEVRQVLDPRLRETMSAPHKVRYGKLFVGPTDAARGMSFDTVFVPGLAERMFPRKIEEEPFVLDSLRRELDGGLASNADRVAEERLLLRLAVGAAEHRVVLSYPRLDLELARPRVPSFYALEAIRAATGTLPNFEELAAQAETAVSARIGWPAPSAAAHAIDEAEHDLAMLHGLRALTPQDARGRASYLLETNPHLGRALRLRPRRGLARWTYADGLVEPGEVARAAMDKHQLSARSFSPTALQTFSQCPYKFFLYAVHRLAPREDPQPVEDLNPLMRGSLVHEVQFRLLSELSRREALPVRPKSLDEAYSLLDDVLTEAAEKVKDDIVPAITRVWDDAIASVRADLREWLELASEDTSGWVPWRFELSFGLTTHREGRDPHSVDEPVQLDAGLSVRGSIDLVERKAGATLRATDAKTGKERLAAGQVIAGGEVLQPVLYALVLAKLFPDLRVEGGRLYYCTTAGGFKAREVPLDTVARESVELLAKTVGGFLEQRFLPAAPADGACRWCDYLTVCGLGEEQRVARKLAPKPGRERVQALLDLRAHP